jgi:pilus assembly protein Flp/PilA
MFRTAGKNCPRPRHDPLIDPGRVPRHMLNRVRDFLADQSAATAIEYSLIAAGIALAIIAVVKGIGPKLNTTFTSVSTQLK